MVDIKNCIKVTDEYDNRQDFNYDVTTKIICGVDKITELNNKLNELGKSFAEKYPDIEESYEGADDFYKGASDIIGGIEGESFKMIYLFHKPGFDEEGKLTTLRTLDDEWVLGNEDY